MLVNAGDLGYVQKLFRQSFIVYSFTMNVECRSSRQVTIAFSKRV